MRNTMCREGHGDRKGYAKELCEMAFRLWLAVLGNKSDFHVNYVVSTDCIIKDSVEFMSHVTD